MRRRTPLPHTRYRTPPGEKGVRTVVWEHQGPERAACSEVLSMLSCERSSMSPNDRELLERRPITWAPEQVSENTNQPPHAAAAFPAFHIRGSIQGQPGAGSLTHPSSLLPLVGVFLSDLKDQTIGRRTETSIRVEWNRVDWDVMGWRRMGGDEILGMRCVRKGGKSTLVFAPKPFLAPKPMAAT